MGAWVGVSVSLRIRYESVCVSIKKMCGYMRSMKVKKEDKTVRGGCKTTQHKYRDEG